MNIEEIFINVSLSAKPKLDIVMAEEVTLQNIAGITPAVLILGR